MVHGYEAAIKEIHNSIMERKERLADLLEIEQIVIHYTSGGKGNYDTTNPLLQSLSTLIKQEQYELRSTSK